MQYSALTANGVTAATVTATTGATAAGSATLIPGPLKFAIGGVIATAKTGIDYRKYCKGEITKDEFTKRTKYTWIGQAGATIGSAGGMIGGFVVG